MFGLQSPCEGDRCLRYLIVGGVYLTKYDVISLLARTLPYLGVHGSCHFMPTRTYLTFLKPIIDALTVLIRLGLATLHLPVKIIEIRHNEDLPNHRPLVTYTLQIRRSPALGQGPKHLPIR